MIRFFIAILISTQAWGNPFALQTPQWNPNAKNVYRLFRLAQPYLNESDPEKRLERELDVLMEETESDTQLDSGEMRSRLAILRMARNLLRNKSFHALCDYFVTGISNKRLSIPSAFKVPANVDPHFQPYLVPDATPIQREDGAGMWQLALLVTFFQVENTLPEFHHQGMLALCTQFDHFLERHGVHGFLASVRPTLVDKRQPFFQIFKEHTQVMHVGLLSGSIACAALLAGAVAYHAFTPPANLRAPSPAQQELELTPQEKADGQARLLGEETAPSLEQPRR